MELILHYVWQHRYYGAAPLRTTQGQEVEVIDPGVHNIVHSGPDFFNAKVKIDGIVWAGNVEVHDCSSDWLRHRHEADAAYNNVVLHVVGKADAEVRTADGKPLPQLVLEVPERILANYRELLAEEVYPPCYRVIPKVDDLTVHSWMSRLTVERLEDKVARIYRYLELTEGDWERTTFILLARNFGFGTNAQAFEQWALSLPPQTVAKHRDDPFQVEAIFMGQAGLLDEALVESEQRDDHFRRLQAEYAFLRHKFGLTPINVKQWRFGRLRPQNFPHVRLSQLTRLYAESRVDFSRILETNGVAALHALFRVGATPYWQTHYSFSVSSQQDVGSRHGEKVLRKSSLNLILINTVAPLLFAYGRQTMDEALTDRAFSLLESLPPERNYIVRCWERAGLTVAHAADSQALLRLRQDYCNRKDCLRCRFGVEYLRSGTPFARR